MYSKYQTIKILEKCFRNMNCFSWITIIPILNIETIVLKIFWLRACCLSHHFCQILLQPTEPLFNPHSPLPLNTIFIMFFIGFSILSYTPGPQATTSIKYTKPYAKPSQSHLLSIYSQIIMPYGSKTLPIKRLNL